VTLAETVQLLLDWIRAHPQLTGLMVLLVALSESLVVVGLIVPGAALMLTFGALIESGSLDFWSTCAWAAAGAILGDGISFLLGYYYRERLVSLWPFRNHPRWIESGNAYFLRHGGKSVILGRFIGPLRASVPAVAGMLAMSPARFLLYNVASALLWAPAYLIPGMVFAASLELASQVAWRLALLLGTVLVLFWCSAWLARQVWRWVAPRVTGWADSLADWSRRHPLLGRWGEALVEPDRPEAPALWVSGGLLLGSVLLLSALPLSAPNSAQANLEGTLAGLAASLRSPWGDRLMLTLGNLGSLPMQALLAAGVFAVLLLAKAPGAARHWLAAVIFGGLLSATHYWLSSPGPQPGGRALLAFPQAGLAGVSFGFLAALLAGEARPIRHPLYYGAAAAGVALVTLAAFYLGAQWPADAALGGVLGLCWAAVVGVAYRRRRQRRIPIGRLQLATTGVLLSYSAIYLAFGIEHDLGKLNLPEPVRSLSAAHWWEHGERGTVGEHLAEVDADSPAMPLQWAGSLAQIAASLGAAGWQSSTALHLSSLLVWLQPEAPLSSLPLLPRLHAGHHEALAMVHGGADSSTRILLRLWPSSARLTDGSPIWLGALEGQRKASRLLGLITATVSQPVDTAALERESLPGTRTRRTGDGQLLLLQSNNLTIGGVLAASILSVRHLAGQSVLDEQCPLLFAHAPIGHGNTVGKAVAKIRMAGAALNHHPGAHRGERGQQHHPQLQGAALTQCLGGVESDAPRAEAHSACLGVRRVQLLRQYRNRNRLDLLVQGRKDIGQLWLAAAQTA
jgi:undecaprenyl-diphosphatase